MKREESTKIKVKASLPTFPIGSETVSRLGRKLFRSGCDFSFCFDLGKSCGSGNSDNEKSVDLERG